MKKVIVMVGLPGSGKSTYIKTILREYPYAEVFSADDYMVDTIGNYCFDPNRLGACHSACLREFTNKIIEDRNDNLFNPDYDSVLVVDNTNLTNIERAPYISLALAFGYEVEVIMVQAKGLTMSDLSKRNVHGVSEETLQRMADKQDTELWTPWKYNAKVKTQTINSNPMPHTTNDGWGTKIKIPRDQCEHDKHIPQHDPAEMRKDNRLSVAEFRAKYPRFQGTCEDCGAQVICYASYAHYIMGDW